MQNRRPGTTLVTFEGHEIELNGMIGLEFYTEGNRGAEMRDRLAGNMPSLIGTYQLLDQGVCAIIALRDMPNSLAEFACAWSAAGMAAETILNGTTDGRGEKQEPFRARLNPEGANPGAKMAIGHDPGVFMRDGDEMVVPLDWRQAGRDNPPWTAEG